MATACILVVDDDDAIRESLVEVFEEQGWRAVGAANGRQAMDMLMNRAADDETCLILLDLMMPVMDGRTFRQEQLKTSGLADIPVVLISAFQDAKEEGARLQVDDVLIKPLQLSDLMRVAKRFCVCDASAP